MHGAARMFLALTLALASCGNDRQETRPETDEAPSPTPAQAPAEEPLPSCPGGQSIDPPEAELLPAEGASTTPQARLNHLRFLMSRYRQSSTLRVQAAALSLGPAPAGNPVEAQRLYQEALALHENGCHLTEALEWEATDNLGLAMLLQGNDREALTVFQRAVARWPTAAQSRYNLACAHCRLGQLEDCLTAFTETLRVADGEDRPDFVTSEVTPYTFIHQARQERDLAPLRADPRFDEVIAPHLRHR